MTTRFDMPRPPIPTNNSFAALENLDPEIVLPDEQQLRKIQYSAKDLFQIRDQMKADQFVPPPSVVELNRQISEARERKLRNWTHQKENRPSKVQQTFKNFRHSISYNPNRTFAHFNCPKRPAWQRKK